MGRAALSKGELEVAQVIWKLGEATVGSVHEVMRQQRDRMEYATVQTYIRRLEAKGYVQSTRVGRTKLYRAKVRPQLVIRETVNDVMKLLFDGQLVPMVRHLVDARGLTSEEISELRQLLTDLEKTDDKSRP